jgi:hypothetical protein
MVAVGRGLRARGFEIVLFKTHGGLEQARSLWRVEDGRGAVGSKSIKEFFPDSAGATKTTKSLKLPWHGALEDEAMVSRWKQRWGGEVEEQERRAGGWDRYIPA